MSVFTVVAMGAFGFPTSWLAAEATTNVDGSVTFREPRARRARRICSSDSPVVIEGNHTGLVHNAVWKPTGDGGTRTAFPSFAPEWSGVMADIARVSELSGDMAAAAAQAAAAEKRAKRTAYARGRAAAARSLGLVRTRSGAWE